MQYFWPVIFFFFTYFNAKAIFIMKKAKCDLDACFFCQACSKDWLELTNFKKETFIFKKNEQFLTEGTTVTGMYFMLSGAVKIHKHWGSEKELIIRFAKCGDILGIRGFGDTFYRISATALEETKACFIPEEHLQASLRINPMLSYRLMQFYAIELNNAEQRMSDLAHRDVKGRVAEALLTLQKTFGEDKDHFLQISLSRQDIAAYAGTTYETVFKIFTEWTTFRWIRTDGRRIQIKSSRHIQSCIV